LWSDFLHREFRFLLAEGTVVNTMSLQPASHGPTRRQFVAGAAAVVVVTVMSPQSPAAAEGEKPQPSPWYRRTLRWGQTNITEIDPARYDIPWWRQYWRRTAVQGVIINAGGIFAYYPSKFPLHHRAAGLGDRDLYGDLARAAHDDGLVVLARMDSNRAHEPMYQAHPDWFAVDANGKPYRAGEQYVSCINGPYYEQYLPDVLREIIERSHPEGFTDNSWSGLGRDSICYCANCSRRFREHAGAKDLPRRHDWDDPIYRAWIEWSYARRLEIWDMNNRVTREAGGPHCLWLGMNSGSVTAQARSFRDYKAIAARSEIIMLDHQSRSDADGFANNAITGKLIHGLLGWDKLIPESMPTYQMGKATFRLSTKPPAEARMWMLAGFAGGIQPWWHHVSAYHEDRRMYHTAEPIMAWHKENEKYLIDRRPLASVGVVWSQGNTDFYGRDNPEELVDQPWRGFTAALVRARIPFVPVHADHIEREAGRLAALVLPNVGALSDSQVAAIRRFHENGGAIVATGRTSLYDEHGDPRQEMALADLLGISGAARQIALDKRLRAGARGATGAQHTYLRLTPELRAGVNGPRAGDEPAPSAKRHPILAGFDETDILPFGSILEPLTVDPAATVLMTFIPPFPTFPPETAWMRQPRTDIPGLIIRERQNTSGPVAYLPADIDRRYAIDNLPDHADLLANIVRWACADNLPLEVTGHGLIDCELYEQPGGRLILHVVNLTSAGTWRAPVDELIPIGPLDVRVRLPQAIAGAEAVRMLVGKAHAPAAVEGQSLRFRIDSVLDHELVVIE
jgi:hypothetical protein